MKLDFEFNSNHIIFEFSNVIFITASKYQILNELAEYLIEILSGKIKNAFIDNLNVTKNQFEVIHVNKDNSMQAELKLTAKSFLMNKLNKEMSTIDNDILEDTFNKINELLLEVEKCFSQSFQSFTDYFNDWKISIESESLNKELKNNFHLISEHEIIPFDISRLMYYHLIFHQEDVEKKIFVIEDFDYGLSLDQCIEVINWIEQINAKVFLFTKNPTILKYFYKEKQILVCNNKIKDLESLIDTFFETEYFDIYLDCFVIENKEEVYERLNLKRYLIPYFIEIITSENYDSSLEKIKNSWLFDKKYLEKLEKFKKHLLLNNEKVL